MVFCAPSGNSSTVYGNERNTDSGQDRVQNLPLVTVHLLVWFGFEFVVVFRPWFNCPSVVKILFIVS